MRTVLHLFWNDLRRLAPFLVLHAGFLAWRVAHFDVEDRSDASSILWIQDLAVIAILALLVIDAPLFARRAFWRTRPIAGGALLVARLLLVIFTLWLPRVLAHLASLRLLGLKVGTVLGNVVALDVLVAHALLLVALLALVSLCRRWIEVGFVVLATSLLFRIQRGLKEWIEHQPHVSDLDRYLSYPLLLAILSAVLGLALAGLYQRRWPWAAAALLLALVSGQVSALGAPVLARWLTGPTTIEAPANLELEVVAAPDVLRWSPKGHPLTVALVPRHLDPDLGLEVLALEGALRTSSGEVAVLEHAVDLEADFSDVERVCTYPERIVQRLPTLTEPGANLLGCGPQLYVPLLELSKACGEPLDGTLELRATLRAFRGELETTPIRPGAAVGRGFETLNLLGVGQPRQDTAEGHVVLHIQQLSLFNKPDAWSGRGRALEVLSLQSGNRLTWAYRNGGGSGYHRHFFLLESRLETGGLELRYSQESLTEVGVEDIRSLHLADFEPTYSNPFTVLLRVENFRAADYGRCGSRR